MLFLILSLFGFCALVVSRLIYEAIGLLQNLPNFFSGIPEIMDRAQTAVERFISHSPDGMQDYISSAVDCIYEKLSEVPGELSTRALNKVSSILSNAPKIILFTATFAIGSFFISRSYPSIRAFIKRQIPQRLHDTASNIKRDILSGLGKWLKAQLTMMCITFLELALALVILDFEYAGIIAVITAFIDALPVFGTGIVLLPWAGFMIVSGDNGRALGLLVTYLIVTVVRSCLEPRLVGAQFGIDPAAALLAMYSGFKLAGVAGMILFPFGLMILKQMNDKGYVKLWK